MSSWFSNVIVFADWKTVTCIKFSSKTVKQNKGVKIINMKQHLVLNFLFRLLLKTLLFFSFSFDLLSPSWWFIPETSHFFFCNFCEHCIRDDDSNKMWNFAPKRSFFNLAEITLLKLKKLSLPYFKAKMTNFYYL